jgi:hypothetical protein
MASESLEVEVERLRGEVDAYRQRELADQRSQLAAARAEADHYRAEAVKVLDNFRQLDAMDREKFARLEMEIATLRQVANRNNRMARTNGT